MAIYRGDGGAGDANTNVTINQVTTKALEAAASATAAAASATEAASSAENAFNENQEAHDQAAAASLSALDAASSATSASGSATLAGSFAAEAGNYKDLAASSEATATYAASQAANSATAAETAQTAAETAQTAAEAAQTATENLFTQFGDQYLGSFASDPTLDNSGNSLTTGDVYWNSTDSVLKFYTGSAWVAPEDVATTAATNAASSASSAATSETNAASSASSASSSATAATASATEAASYAASINPADIVHISGTETVTGVKTFSSAPVLSGGTANGVAYLNGYKALTSGSALTFDGTNLGVSSILDASGGSTATVNGYTPTASNMAGRNRIINGDMRIDQRNSGGSVATTTTGVGTYTLDRWAYIVSQASKVTVQQNAGSVTPPVGFTNYIGFTSTSAYSISSTDYFGIFQPIEGFNTADLGWGTANAASITVSFWVRSSLTGTFGASIRNGLFNRSYTFTYTISVANTWEKKTVTIAGDTSGTWNTTSDKSIVLFFGLGVGSSYSNTSGAWVAGNYSSATGATSVVGTNGATFYITGVQLEEGSVATPFEHRQYGQELALCQRYYYVHYHTGSSGTRTMPLAVLYATTGWEGTWAGVRTPVPMRSSPTVSTSLAYVIHTGDIYSTLSYSSFGARHLGCGIYSCGGYGGVGTAGTKGMMMCEAQNAITSFTAEL